MVFWIILMLAGVTELLAFPKTLTPGACTTKTLPTSDENANRKFLTSVDVPHGGWAYQFSSVNDKGEGLSSASLTIAKTPDVHTEPEESYTIRTIYQIKSHKVDPIIEDIVIEKNNKLVTKSTVKDKSATPETEYVILKFKPKAYVYFYKCSNAPAAVKGRDARFVLVWNSALSKEDKKEIEDFDHSLSEGEDKIFNGQIQEI